MLGLLGLPGRFWWHPQRGGEVLNVDHIIGKKRSNIKRGKVVETSDVAIRVRFQVCQVADVGVLCLRRQYKAKSKYST